MQPSQALNPKITAHRNYLLPSYAKLFPNFLHLSRSRGFNYFVNHAINHHRSSFAAKHVTYLNSHPLSDSEKSLLDLGLNFVPTPNITQHHIRSSFNRITDIYDKHKHFSLFPYNPPARTHPFHVKSSWTPPDRSHIAPRAPTSLDFRQFRSTTDSTSPSPNISTSLQESLNYLIHNPDITIKRSDKGGGITVMDTDRYITQIIDEHLSDRNTYLPLPSSPTAHFTNLSNTLVDFLLYNHHIDLDTAAYLRPPIPARTPIFYGLPKTHKPNVPLRPIVSGFDSPTDNFAKYITHFLVPLADQLPTKTKDSFTFKRYLDSIPPLPANAILVTADIKSLYTNIPINEGINTVCDYIHSHRDSLPSYAPPTSVFRIILEHILRHNAFRFLDSFFLQTSGTAMGCRMAPPYADIFLSPIDNRIISLHDLIRHYKRYIDDIFFIFLGPLSDLLHIQRRINELHPTIKFTLSYSFSSINFLDLHIYIDHFRRLRTSIYLKPTDCMSYLHWQSHHQDSTKLGLIRSQTIRFNRLIDSDSDLHSHLHKFTIALLIRGFRLPDINQEIKIGLNRSQHDSLYAPTRPKPAPESFHNSVTIPFSQIGLQFRSFVTAYTHELANAIAQDDPIDPVISTPHIRTVFTRTSNLADLITHTDTLRPPPMVENPDTL